MYYIGVDLGTSAVKLLLMDGSGKIMNIVSREYPLSFPHPGWSEQKPEDWWEQSKEGIKELTEGFDKSQVAGISFGGQMHGLVILDPVYGKYCVCRFYRSEDPLGEGKRAGEFCEDLQDHAAEGLSGVQTVRIFLHGLFRCVRNASAGCTA